MKLWRTVVLSLYFVSCSAASSRPFAIKHCKSAVSHVNCGLGAFPQSKIFKLVSQCIENKGFKHEHLLIATSCCPDEINRDLDHELSHMGRAFNMGGLAGFPFVGKTGFGAFMHHVPDGGHMLIVCASHVGIDKHGNVGKLNRVGMDSDSSACGAAIAAYKFCEKNSDPNKLAKICDGDECVYPGFSDPLDSQQNYIQKFVASKFHEIRSAPNPMAALAVKCAERIKEDLVKIFPEDVHYPVFILNGIQINFEGEDVGEDYFCPLSFVLRDTHEEIHDLLPALRELRDADLAHDAAILDFWRKDLEKRPGVDIADSAASAIKHIAGSVAGALKLRVH